MCVLVRPGARACVCVCVSHRCSPVCAGQDAVDLYLAPVQRAQIHPQLLGPVVCRTKALPSVVLLRVLSGKSKDVQINTLVKFCVHRFVLLEHFLNYFAHMFNFTRQSFSLILFLLSLIQHDSNRPCDEESGTNRTRLIAERREDLLRKVRKTFNFPLFKFSD